MANLLSQKHFNVVVFFLIIFLEIMRHGAIPQATASDYPSQGGFYYQAYLSANPDLPANWGKAECMNHYIQFGFRENRAVCLNIDEYLNANPDLPSHWTYEDGLNHYHTFGKNEKRLLAFDAQEYLSLYADLPQAWSYDQAYNHFMFFGRNEGRIASFDEKAYLEMYPDLPREWEQAEAFVHYLYYGQSEGRVYDPYDEDAFLSSGGDGLIPDTGQTTSSTHTFGEDSDYTINPPSYTKLDASGNALADSTSQWTMVKDNVTGLIWENKTDDNGIHDKDNTYTWQNAHDSYIDQLNGDHFGGFSNWRLPTVRELSTLVNAERWNPEINTAYFQHTISHGFWSSTTISVNSDLAWYVGFYDGNVHFYYKSDDYRVRAVCGGPSGVFGDSIVPGRMVDNGDGTVSDVRTGLMWQQANAGSMNWTAALSYCENLQLANHDDWRLPNRNELQSLVDYSQHFPAIDTVVFPEATSSGYWSSTNSANSGYAWLVEFYYGIVSDDSKSENYLVRAVRGGGNAASVPGAPTLGTATGGNGQATITFTAPSSNGGSAITGYRVTSNPGGITGTGTASPITVTGLTNATTYTFTVQAINAVGTGPASAASNSVTPQAPATAPGAPTLGTATGGNGQATITFTTPSSNGGSAIIGYVVTANPGGNTGTGTASPITVTGLTNATTYTFTVQAINAVGTGPASAASNSVTPQAPATVPGAPTIGTATGGNGQATITFTTPSSNGGSAITGYVVTANPGGNTGTGTASPITVTGLTHATTYTFTVQAINAVGTGPASAASNSVTLQAVVTDDHGNNCTRATPVTLNSTRSGTIEIARDIDYFRIQVVAAGTLTVCSTGGTDTYGYLKNSSCTNIEEDDDDGDGSNFYISRSVSTGTYYVAVKHFSSSGSGSYTFCVNFTSQPAVDSIAFQEHGTNYGYDNYTHSSHPWKSLETGRTDTVRAVINPSSAYAYVSFLSSAPGNATVAPTTPTSASQILTNQGGSDRGISRIKALVDGSDFTYYQAAIYKKLQKTVAVTLVHERDSDGSGPNRGYTSTDITNADIIAELKKVYKQAIIEWTVVRRPAQSVDFDINNDGEIDVESWMSNEMERIRDTCGSNHEFNIFLVDNPSDGSLGFMSYNQKYGFIHADQGNGPNTVAHEIGHGQGLSHTNNDLQNLMHYREPNPWRLRKNQWDQLNP